MNRWANLLLALLILTVLGQSFWIWQLKQSVATSGIEVRANNMGVELASDAGRVIVHPIGQEHIVVVDGPLAQELPVGPGTYDIQVVFTNASDAQSAWLRDIKVEAGQRVSQTAEFSSGELLVEALAEGIAEGLVNGQVRDTDRQVLAYVFNREDHDNVITSMAAGAPVLVAPGVYDIRVVLTQDSQEKEVRWQKEVPVKSGLQTRIRVPFDRGSVLIEASNGEQQLTHGAVELAVYRAGDRDLKQLEVGVAGSPLGLAVGRYDVAATFTASHDKPVLWLYDLVVELDQTLETHIQFESGTVAVTATLAGGEALARFDAYVYFYRAGEHTEPVAYASVSDPVVLAAGHYDARVNFFRSHDRPDIWLRALEVPIGERLEKTVEFPSGNLVVRAFDSSGNELIGDTVFLQLHAAGERRRALAVARSGELLTLIAGRYDIRAEDSRRPGHYRWLENVEVVSGQQRQQSIEY